jgi:hypothetical protein
MLGFGMAWQCSLVAQEFFDQSWHDPIIHKTPDCLLRKCGADDI